MNAHEVLCEARNLIDREGWWQGWYESIEGHCASNAISTAAPGNDDARRELRRVVGAVNLEELFAWNDCPRRTKDDVLAAFDKAIAATSPPPSDPLEGVEMMAEVVA